MTEHVLYETQNHVALITLNRPEALNAMNKQMRAELARAQNKAEADSNIRVVVLTGAGDTFSSGTDLSEAAEKMAEAEPFENFDNSVRDYKPLIDAVTKSDKIYMAAINGFAGGVSLGLAMGADLAIMAEEAVMFSPFANVGLVPDGGASWYLLHHLGYKRAFQAIAECTRFDGKTCFDLGLINKVVPASDLEQVALTWAQELAGRAPLSLKYTKKILRAAATSSQEQTALLESEYQMKAVNSEDASTAINSFLNKTKPVFKGQ